MSPELSRALSFYFQRATEAAAQVSPGEYSKQDLQDSDFSNCVFIDYADLSSSDTFGQFFFDESVSSPEKLYIQIDNSYKQYDDVLIAVLLAHELQHAQQFLNYLYDGSTLNCIDSEENAFMSEWYFLGSLSEYEKKLFSERYPRKVSEIKNLPQPLQDAWNLTLLSKEASDACGRNDLRCYQDTLEKNIREYVKDLYSEQCAVIN